MVQLKYTSIHACHLTLKINDEHKEFSFFKDEIYDLPEDNSVVIRMQAQGLLEATLTNTQLKNKKSNGS
jgi:hypothetical protein